MRWPMAWQLAGARFRAWWLKRFGPRPLDVRGEDAAAKFLRRKGYRIVGRRIRNNYGELDLVAIQDRQLVVFVEVKTRQHHLAGHPSEAVDAAKQRHISRAAATYVKRHQLEKYPKRLDIIAVTWAKDARHPIIEHYPGAFEAIGVD